VVVIYAGTHGLTDDIPVPEVQRFERELRAYFRAKHTDLLEQIRDTGQLPDESAMDAAISELRKPSSQTTTRRKLMDTGDGRRRRGRSDAGEPAESDAATAEPTNERAAAGEPTTGRRRRTRERRRRELRSTDPPEGSSGSAIRPAELAGGRRSGTDPPPEGPHGRVDEEDHAGDGAHRSRRDVAGPGSHRRLEALPERDERVLADVTADGSAPARLMGQPESPEHVAIVAIVSDRGLAGGYNAFVLRQAEREMKTGQSAGRDYTISAAGKKALPYFRFRGRQVDHFIPMPDAPPTRRPQAGRLRRRPVFSSGELDLVQLVSTRFMSAGIQTVETASSCRSCRPTRPSDASRALLGWRRPVKATTGPSPRPMQAGRGIRTGREGFLRV